MQERIDEVEAKTENNQIKLAVRERQNISGSNFERYRPRKPPHTVGHRFAGGFNSKAYCAKSLAYLRQPVAIRATDFQHGFWRNLHLFQGSQNNVRTRLAQVLP